MSWLLDVAATSVAAALVLFAARRVLLACAALIPGRQLAAGRPVSLGFVVAARNEERVLGRLLDALDRLDYPAELLTTVIVDDGSSDGTGALLERWSLGRARTKILVLPDTVGKAAALDAAIVTLSEVEAVVVCDADLSPARDCLRRLAAVLADESVGAVAGYMRPVNAEKSAVARYAAVETWMTQLVTSAGKDRLGLDPPTLGFSAYRRRALEAIGGFGPDGADEDLIATVSLGKRKWRTRFAPEAVADNLVVERLGDYWRQHVRWAGNTLAAGRAAGWGTGSPLRRIETWLMSAGYADRLALLAAAALAAAGKLPLWLPPSYLGLRAIETVIALVKGGVRRRLPIFLLWTFAFFAIDVAASLAAAVSILQRRQSAWRSPGRAEAAGLRTPPAVDLSSDRQRPLSRRAS